MFPDNILYTSSHLCSFFLHNCFNIQFHHGTWIGYFKIVENFRMHHP